MNRLGSAGLAITINDKEGFVVRHLTDGIILASKPASECTRYTWDALWECLENLGVQRANLNEYE